MKKERPRFYALYKDFNSGKMRPVEIIDSILAEILTVKNKIRKDFKVWSNDYSKLVKLETREQLKNHIILHIKYRFRYKCEWEFITLKWPYRTEIKPEWDDDNKNIIDINSPEKIDVYDQLILNIDVITDLVWNYIEDKLK